MTAQATSVPVGWIDCSSGVSGDMLLGALEDVGAVAIASFAGSLGVDVGVVAQRSARAGLAGVNVTVTPGDGQPHRRLAEVLALLDAASVLTADVREKAAAVFRRLAIAEGRVHGTSPDNVEFHEVGAVDAIVDVVGVCQGLHALGLQRLVASPVSLGGGEVRTAHGVLPVPGPAVLELLAGSRLLSRGGPVDVELATPTGVALLAELADDAGPMPAMDVQRVGIGLGERELGDRPNALRLVLGTTAPAASDDGDWQLLEANVDDLDPRLWPTVIARLLAVGAGDAWLTPIVMKKGRPAQTVSVLVAADRVDAACRVLFTESTTIGVRTTSVGKRALARRWIDVDVDGCVVRVKLAALDGTVVNAVPEFEDVAAAAATLGRPAKAVLAAATAAARDSAQVPGR